ncbi:MAG: hypothetical protein WAM82_23375 [Thermoanaerobaculia bacterium]
MNTYTLEDARIVKPKALRVFGKQASVVGVGITEIDGGYGLKVNLREAPSPGVALPDTVDGIPVRVEIVGSLHKL